MSAMKTLKFILVLLGWVGVVSVQAQDAKPYTGWYTSANLGILPKQQTLALSGAYHWGIGSARKFKVGIGLRATASLGRDMYYETAPAKLTSNQEGPQVLFVESQRGNIDSVQLGSTALTAFNAFLQLEYAISHKWDVGLNIDLAGLTVGGGSTGTFISSYNTGTPPLDATAATAKPTALNALLISDNDRGSLNSEVYVRYHFHDAWAAQAGVSFLFTEYTTDQKFKSNFDNDRFRNKGLLPVVGISFYPGR